jgi:hypothetical protein
VSDSSREKKRPAFQFYPGDWRRDTGLQTCSLAARGLWIEMICLMHDGEPYGHLRVGAKSITEDVLARLVGESGPRVRQLIAELEDAGVCSRREDGTLFSRRMVRDEQVRNARAEGGKASVAHPTVAARVKDLVKADAEGGVTVTGSVSASPSLPAPLPPPLSQASPPPSAPPTGASLPPPPAFAFASASASAFALAPADVRAADPDPPPPAARSKRPIFAGHRLVVFEWQLDDLTRMLGDHTEGFDLHAWFDALDQRARASGVVIPQRDNGAWLQAHTLCEAQRRGLPIAVAPAVHEVGKQTTRLAGALARIRAEERA